MTQDSHAPREAGFTHLRDLLPDPVEIVLASTPPSNEGRGTTGGRESLPFPVNADCDHREAFGEGGVRREKGVRGRREGRGGRGRAVDSSKCFADYLARRLRDEKSTAWYQLVVRVVPREVVQDALARTLDAPRRDIRRSRAALFTSIVLPHVRRARRAPRP